MYRTTGLALLGIGVVISLSMIFTGFEHTVKSWEVDQTTGDVSQVTISCVAPLNIVFGDGESQADPSWGVSQCASTGQRLFITGVGIFAVALGFGIWGIRRGPRPKVKSIQSVPSFGAGETES